MDGELSPADRAAFVDHLAGCESCRAAFEQFKKIRTDLKKLPNPPLPWRFNAKVLAAARGRENYREYATPRWVLGLSVAGVFAVMCLVISNSRRASYQRMNSIGTSVGSAVTAEGQEGGASSEPSARSWSWGRPQTTGVSHDAPAPSMTMHAPYAGGLKSRDVGFEMEHQMTSAAGVVPDAKVGRGIQMIGPALSRRILYKEAAKFPAWVREQGIAGTVRVYFTLSKDGKIVATRLTKTSGYPQIDEIVLNAVKKWQFSPDPDNVWGILTFEIERHQ